MILTWVCQFCGWANDNNNGPCHKCGARTEEQRVRGRWRTVTIIPPDAERERAFEQREVQRIGDGTVW